MEFAQKIADLANRSRNASKHALTEEATKTGVVLPLIKVLGFDPFDLEEVIPEFVADVGIKKGEKIDFALRVDGKISVLIEAKPISMSLGQAQFSQLYRYFSVVEARLAILTNGREIWFFSDIDERNKMDKKPFFVFDLQNYDEHQVAEFARFQKSGFDIEAILDAASNLKYVKAASAYLSQQLVKPDEDFVRFMGRFVYDGSVTKGVVEMLRPAVQAALDEVVRTRIQERLNVTFGKEALAAEAASEKPPEVQGQSDPGVLTTEDEILGFMIVRAIAAKVAPIDRITMRDAKSYCSIFVDDNNRKPVCRLYFNAKSTRSIGLFSASKEERKVQISDISDIYKYSIEIEATVAAYTS
ncbi:MAG: type I restriction enzyme HsdR N-terminal domain-containing protein [Rhodobacteraceae bacterium]|nr:type I restriction enzyme HsdR N-terminal domain-containing protein [Paracoccaceae bacterium]